MATQFDATARIQLDLRSFASGAQQVTREGGVMDRVFRNLQSSMTRVETIDKQLARSLTQTFRVYNQGVSVVSKFASSLKTLVDLETKGANSTRLFAKAFDSLRTALAQVNGVSEKEYQRLNRTLQLYERMANVLLRLSQVQRNAATITENQVKAQERQQRASERAAAAQQRAANQQAAAQERQRQAAERAAAAQERLNRASDQAGGRAVALRDDLSQLGTLYQQLAQYATAAATASVDAAIRHEAAFAQVLRVTQETGEGAVKMREEFEKLTTQLPVSFEELSRIGQLASQTGVANEQLVAFARTVVQFSVTTGIASDQVTVLFARIADMQDLPTNQMNNFASTILRLGSISAATENEILKVNQSIGSSARVFGLTTEEIAGLSGALASLRIPPEWARGSATRIFRDLDTAANEAGDGLQTLQEVLGMTGEEITKLRRENPGEFFLRFVEGMQQYTREGQLAADSTRTITDVMSELGVNAVRDIDFITRLANNFGTLKTQTNEAFLEFARGTELTKQTEIIFGTTRQRIDNMKDAFETFIAAAGEPFRKVIGFIAERLTVAIEAFREMNPVLKTTFGILFGVVSVATAVAAAIALYRLALVKAVRGIIAYNQVQRQMNGQALTGRSVLQLYRSESERTRQSIVANTQAQRDQATAIQQTTAAARQASASTGSNANQVRQTNLAAQANQNLSQSYSRVIASTTAARFAAEAQRATLDRNFRAVASYAEAWRVVERSMPTATQAIRNNTATAGQQAAVLRQVGFQQTAIQNSSVRMADAMLRLDQAQRQAATGATGVATGTRNIGAAGQVAAVGMRAATAATQLFRAALASIGIGLIITALTSLYFAVTKTADAEREAAKAGFDAAGGQTAFGDAVRKDEKAIADGARVIATLTAAEDNLSAADRERIRNRLAAAQQEKVFVEALGGSIESLREQAKGTGESAEAAGNFVKRWEAADDIVQRMTQSLKGNTFQISENTQTLAEFSVQQAVMNNEASKNLAALEELRKFGPRLRESMDQMFTNPTKSAQILTDEINRVAREIERLDSMKLDDAGLLPAANIDDIEANIKGLQDYSSILSTIRENAKLNENAIRGGQLANEAFGRSATEAAAGADAMANGMDEAADSGDALESIEEKLAARTESLAQAFSSLGDFSTAMSAALEKAGQSQDAQNDAQAAATERSEDLREAQRKLQESLAAAGGSTEKTRAAYDRYNKSLRDIQAEAGKTTASNDAVRASFGAIMAELEAVAQARLTRAQNLVRLSARLPEEVLAELEKLGPEFAGFIQDLTEKSDTELAKLLPTLRAAGEGASTAYAEGLASLLPLLAGRGRDMGDAVAAALREAIDNATRTGGDIGQAIAGIAQAIRTSQKLNIPLSVAIDLAAVQGDVSKVEGVIDEAVRSGRLTAEASVQLKTDLFRTALSELQTLVKGTQLDPQGTAKLNPEQYDRDRERLSKDAAATTLQGLINIQGLAKLDPKLYNDALKVLKQLGIDVTNRNEIGMSGKATLETEKDYMRKFREMERESINRGSKISLKATANLQTDAYYRSLTGGRGGSGGIVGAAWTAGESIQQALTRTATVSVVYSYYVPPAPKIPKQMAAATGGLVQGPGGPKDDSILMRVSNGEFIINAKSTKRFAPLLAAINSYGTSSSPGRNLFSNAGVQSTSDLAGVGGRSSFLDQAVQRRRQIYGGNGTLDTTGSGRAGTVININNQYPQAEPTSTTINRSLAYAATISGVS